VELETFLEARGKKDLLAEIRKISNLINFSYVRQGEPLGLGHAVLVTEPLVGDEPFAVILGDDVIDANPPALQQMITFSRGRGTGPRGRARAARRRQLVRHHRRRGDSPGRLPHPRSGREAAANEAPSDLAIIGRYILTPDIFPGARSDVSGSDRRNPAHQRSAPPVEATPIYGCRIDGVRHDAGNKLGFLKAVVYFALRARPGNMRSGVSEGDRSQRVMRLRIALRRARGISFDDEVEVSDFVPTRLRVRLLLAAFGSGRPAVARRLLRVVGDVPPDPLNWIAGDDRAFAPGLCRTGTRVNRRIREFLNAFETVVTGLALVFVQRHEVQS
jgi:hypothetical protein